MRDLVFLITILAFFAAATLFVAAVERMVGRPPTPAQRER
jgi:hypothetical protein